MSHPNKFNKKEFNKNKNFKQEIRTSNFIDKKKNLGYHLVYGGGGGRGYRNNFLEGREMKCNYLPVHLWVIIL